MHYKTYRDQIRDFVDIEWTINYFSCSKPSLCSGKRGSTYAANQSTRGGGVNEFVEVVLPFEAVNHERLSLTI